MSNLVWCNFAWLAYWQKIWSCIIVRYILIILNISTADTPLCSPSKTDGIKPKISYNGLQWFGLLVLSWGGHVHYLILYNMYPKLLSCFFLVPFHTGPCYPESPVVHMLWGTTTPEDWGPGHPDLWGHGLQNSGLQWYGVKPYAEERPHI